MLFKSAILALAASQLVAGHGAIIKAVGDAGGSGQAIGSKYSSAFCLSFHLSQHVVLTRPQLTTPLPVTAPSETPSNKIPPVSRTPLQMHAERPSLAEPTTQPPKFPRCWPSMEIACHKLLQVAQST